MMGLSAEEAQAKFGFLLDAFAFGAPPHGGIAFGWDRICALLSGTDSIRDVIAFPKSGGGVDPLTDAPAPITPEQRKEAGVDAKPSGVSLRRLSRARPPRRPPAPAVREPHQGDQVQAGGPAYGLDRLVQVAGDRARAAAGPVGGVTVEVR